VYGPEGLARKFAALLGAEYGGADAPEIDDAADVEA
jgi:hypothetical protein